MNKEYILVFKHLFRLKNYYATKIYLQPYTSQEENVYKFVTSFVVSLIYSATVKFTLWQLVVLNLKVIICVKMKAADTKPNEIEHHPSINIQFVDLTEY